jgi:hypothetical protein
VSLDAARGKLLDVYFTHTTLWVITIDEDGSEAKHASQNAACHWPALARRRRITRRAGAQDMTALCVDLISVGIGTLLQSFAFVRLCFAVLFRDEGGTGDVARPPHAHAERTEFPWYASPRAAGDAEAKLLPCFLVLANKKRILLVVVKF